MKKHALHVLFLLAASGLACAQTVSIGVKGGIPLISPNTYNDESRRYIVGPSIEVRLPAGFAIEADALYQRVGSTNGYSYLQGTGSVTYVSHQRGNSWEFPLIAKYYFGSGRKKWQPYLGTGYEFRTVGYHGTTSYSDTTGTNLLGGPQSGTYTSDYRSTLGVGALVTAGMRFRLGRFAVSPEVRYTRWGSSENGLRKNEVNLLVGFSF